MGGLYTMSSWCMNNRCSRGLLSAFCDSGKQIYDAGIFWFLQPPFQFIFHDSNEFLGEENCFIIVCISYKIREILVTFD